LFVTTGYSFRNSIGSVKDVVERLKALNYVYAPIADIASTWTFTEWAKESKMAGLKPVYGVQLAVSPAPTAKKPVSDLWTFIARDDVESINKLVSLATSQFRYTPLLTYEQALAAEGVFIITGHKAQFQHFKPQSNLFVGISPASSKGFINKAITEGHKFAAAQVNAYINETDKELWEIACGRGASTQTYPQWILSKQEWKNSVAHLPASEEMAWLHLEDILEACNVTLPQADIIRPVVDKTLREMCLEGAKKYDIDLSRDGYMDRLNHELEIISVKNFDDYFFVMADIMQFARANMVCGPGRGSSAGSLVCYCLGITSVDPIKYGLLFFRFIDPNRPDWPDIDSDLDPEKRQLVWEYIKTKYGADRFAKVGALAYFQTTNALNEACKALGVPRFEADKVESKVVDYAAMDTAKLTALRNAFNDTKEGQAFLKKHPQMIVAADIVGTPTHSSTHAGGVFITNEPISKYVAVDLKTDTAQIDKDWGEKRGLVKIDLLGLNNLMIFEEALRNAGLTRDYLNTIPLDDQKAFDILNNGKFTGTFQFEGHAARNLTKEAVVESLDDISILSALARPGPLSSGAAGKWVKKRKGIIPVDYPHELLKPYLLETLGELVYQEQVMLIAHEVAGMDWKTVSKLRKAIGKSQGETALREYGDPFIAGLVSAGVPDNIAASFWREIIGFGSYGFNKSHSIAYGIVSYWSCYLKAHFPLEFAAASLSFRPNVDTQIELLRELAAEGISYTPVDVENSTDKWRVVNGRLIGPLSLVKGLGPKSVQTILSCRARNEPLPERAQKLLETAKTPIDELFPVRIAVEKIDLEAMNIVSKTTPAIQAIPNGSWQEGCVVIGCVRLMEERDENEEKRVQDRLDRGQQGKYTGNTKFIELRVFDDTGEIYAKIGRNEFDSLGQKVIDKVVNGKTLICVKGTITPEAPVLLVKNLKIVGEME